MERRKRSTFGRPVQEQQPSQQRSKQLFLGLTAFERHKRLLSECITLYGGSLPTLSSQLEKTDYDILQEQHRFIRSEEDDQPRSWEVALAKKYYSKLFREYCIADLSRHQEGKIGLRWRIQAELVSGKGQFVCGAKGCEEKRGLSSFEVNFAYQEAGESKQALVKLRVCPKHAEQLNYQKHHKLLKAARKRKRAKSSTTGRRSVSQSPTLEESDAEADAQSEPSDQDIISQLLS